MDLKRRSNLERFFHENALTAPTSTASEREGDTLIGFNDFRTKNGSCQGQNLAVTGLFLPSTLDSAPEHTFSALSSETAVEPMRHTQASQG